MKDVLRGLSFALTQLPTLQAIVGSESMDPKDLSERLMSLTSVKASQRKVLVNTQILRTDSDSDENKPTKTHPGASGELQQHGQVPQIPGSFIGTSTGINTESTRRDRHVKFLDQKSQYRKNTASEIKDADSERVPGTHLGVDRSTSQAQGGFVADKAGKLVLTEDAGHEVVDISGSKVTSRNVQIVTKSLEGLESSKDQSWMQPGSVDHGDTTHTPVVSLPSRALEWMGSNIVTDDLVEDLKNEGPDEDIHTVKQGRASHPDDVSSVEANPSFRLQPNIQEDGSSHMGLDDTEKRPHQSEVPAHGKGEDMTGLQAPNVVWGEMPRESISGHKPVVHAQDQGITLKTPEHIREEYLDGLLSPLPASGDGGVSSPEPSPYTAVPGGESSEHPQIDSSGQGDEMVIKNNRTAPSSDDQPLSKPTENTAGEDNTGPGDSPTALRDPQIDDLGGADCAAHPSFISLPSGALDWIGDESPSDNEDNKHFNASGNQMSTKGDSADIQPISASQQMLLPPSTGTLKNGSPQSTEPKSVPGELHTVLGKDLHDMSQDNVIMPGESASVSPDCDLENQLMVDEDLPGLPTNEDSNMLTPSSKPQVGYSFFRACVSLVRACSTAQMK